ncbi:MAG: ParB/RepB/Spo0J family partition protein [Chloroflexi bacterium]|nr:ParB/RepB/Spo0J family partition protein [Chloroflexota bacterium]
MPRKRSGLGKGLDALIPGGESRLPGDSVAYVPVKAIRPNPRQPRTRMDPDALAELTASIREHGVIQPLVLAHDPEGDGYILIAGERRWQAAQLAGLARVPAIVREASEQQLLELALIENIQRADLNPLETAEAYRQLHEEFGLSHEEIAQRVGKSRVAVSNTLRLLKLAPEVREALLEGRISEGHARALLGLPTHQAQAAALQTVENLGLTVRQTEALVRRLNGERPEPKPKAEPSPELRALEERLESALGTKVRLSHSRKGGALTIYYYSDEELEALLKRLGVENEEA